MKTKLITVFIFACALISGCHRGGERICQFSTINALMSGSYDGYKYPDLTRVNDFGIGTFDKLDGEMVVLDGTIYQVKSNGNIYTVPKNPLTPFVVVTRFSSDDEIKLKGIYNFEELQNKINSKLRSKNIFYAIRIDGSFEYVRTRSVPAQQKPYPKLTEVAKKQPVFEAADIMGTLVGFKCPDYVSGFNVPGYHLHFISDKKDFGGHLLECRVRDPLIKIDYIRQIEIKLPPGGDFDSTDLRIDPNSINKAEK